MEKKRIRNTCKFIRCYLSIIMQYSWKESLGIRIKFGLCLHFQKALDPKGEKMVASHHGRRRPFTVTTTGKGLTVKPSWTTRHAPTGGNIHALLGDWLISLVGRKLYQCPEVFFQWLPLISSIENYFYYFAFAIPHIAMMPRLLV